MLVSWFSAGVSSAVATKLVADRIDRVIYIHIDDHHDDTMRFVRECEAWFGVEVEVRQHPYKSVENACRMAGGKGYINGVGGAACTHRLKRAVRKEWEAEHAGSDITYVWGMDFNEADRAERLRETMPDVWHEFPLIDKSVSKQHAHEILRASGIKRPQMYELGYNNNNCVGCVKGGMAYWNKVRRDFPAVFDARAKMERLIGASCISGVYLDELDRGAGRGTAPIVDDCGIFCEMMKL